jgi:hypothetical protein
MSAIWPCLMYCPVAIILPTDPHRQKLEKPFRDRVAAWTKLQHCVSSPFTHHISDMSNDMSTTKLCTSQHQYSPVIQQGSSSRPDPRTDLNNSFKFTLVHYVAGAACRIVNAEACSEFSLTSNRVSKLSVTLMNNNIRQCRAGLSNMMSNQPSRKAEGPYMSTSSAVTAHVVLFLRLFVREMPRIIIHHHTLLTLLHFQTSSSSNPRPFNPHICHQTGTTCFF